MCSTHACMNAFSHILFTKDWSFMTKSQDSDLTKCTFNIWERIPSIKHISDK